MSGLCAGRQTYVACSTTGFTVGLERPHPLCAATGAVRIMLALGEGRAIGLLPALMSLTTPGAQTVAHRWDLADAVAVRCLAPSPLWSSSLTFWRHLGRTSGLASRHEGRMHKRWVQVLSSSGRPHYENNS